ncbi:MAG: hypothetical protein VCE91_01605 [Nitrospinota bacterium]
MQRIKVEQAATDMVIAQPVETSTGQVLCSKETVLTQTLIDRLEKIDITHITVEGHPVDDGKPVKTFEEEMAEIDIRFRSVLDNKLMAALKVVVQKHIQKKYKMLSEEIAASEKRNQEAEESETAKK